MIITIRAAIFLMLFSSRSAFHHVTHKRQNYYIPLARKTQTYNPRSQSQNTLLSSTTSDIEEYKNRNNIRDQVFSALSGCGGIKVTSVTARNLVNDLITTHSMTPVPADALGRSILCGLLLSNGMQAEQTFQLTVKGDGPLRGACSVVTGSGEARGYVGNSALNGFTLQEAVGSGTIQVVKNHPDWPQPFNGITEIRNGDIDRDVGIYLAESEQRSCALAAATSMNGILCTAAGGYLVEQLPGVESDALQKIEENLIKLVERDGGDTVPTQLMQHGLTPLEITEMILDGLGMKPLQQITPSLKCQCTDERLFRAIRLLPKEDVEEIMSKNDGISARCEFCAKEYRMSPKLIMERLAQATGDPARDEI